VQAYDIPMDSWHGGVAPRVVNDASLGCLGCKIGWYVVLRVSYRAPCRWVGACSPEPVCYELFNITNSVLIVRLMHGPPWRICQK
jgi:hypothetical protein